MMSAMTDQVADDKTSSCAHCGASIEREPNVGWVDTVSGDDGGTYDVCVDSPNGHRPA